MAFENLGAGALDYYPCRYGKSRLLFRGPRARLTDPYFAVLGGTETYGKFIKRPYPSLVAEQTGLAAVNFGCVNAGADVFLNDPPVLDICASARVTVVQVMGAQNISNRFYAVHPRRNDRFLRASSLMKTIYRNVDFTEFNFTRHLLGTLYGLSPEKFVIVRDELQEAWLARMTQLLGRISGKTVLLWMAGHRPDDIGDDVMLGPDPMFVDRQMIERIRPLVTDVVEIVPPAGVVKRGAEGMVYSAMEEPAASDMLGVATHEAAAAALSKVLRAMI